MSFKLLNLAKNEKSLDVREIDKDVREIAYILQRFSACSIHSTLRLHRLPTADLYNIRSNLCGGERPYPSQTWFPGLFPGQGKGPANEVDPIPTLLSKCWTTTHNLPLLFEERLHGMRVLKSLF